MSKSSVSFLTHGVLLRQHCITWAKTHNIINYCKTRYYWRARAHTHTHTFNGPFSGTTRVSRYQKGKPIWILLEQETVNSSGISWANMQVCTSLQTVNHASTPPLSFFTGRIPSCLPTNSVKALKA